MGPLGACRVGWDGKKYQLNPKIDEYDNQFIRFSGCRNK